VGAAPQHRWEPRDVPAGSRPGVLAAGGPDCAGRRTAYARSVVIGAARAPASLGRTEVAGPGGLGAGVADSVDAVDADGADHHGEHRDDARDGDGERGEPGAAAGRVTGFAVALPDDHGEQGDRNGEEGSGIAELGVSVYQRARGTLLSSHSPRSS
jgi:hypothetical protein